VNAGADPVTQHLQTAWLSLEGVVDREAGQGLAEGRPEGKP